MTTGYPVQGLMAKNLVKELNSDSEESNDKSEDEVELWTLKRLAKRQKMDGTNAFAKLLKYRGVKQFPLKEQVCCILFIILLY